MLAESIYVLFQGQTDGPKGVDKAFKDVQKKTEEIAKQSSGSSDKGGGGFGLGVVAGVAAGATSALISFAKDGVQFAFNSLYGLATQAMETAGVVDDAVQNLGGSTEELSSLGHYAKMNGVEFDGLTTALEKMNMHIADVQTSGKASAALDRLGLSAAKLSGMSPDEKFKAIADGISQIDDEGQKAAIAMDIFGKQGVKLVAALSGGSAAIEEAQKAADLLGITLKSEDSAKINEMNDQFDTLGEVLNGVGQQIAAEVAPYLSEMIQLLLDSGIFGENMSQTIKGGMKIVGTSIGFVLDFLDVFRDAWNYASAAAMSSVQAIVEGLAYIGDAFDAVARNTTGTELGIGKALHETAAEMSKDVQKAWGDADAAFTRQTWGEQFQQWFDQVGNAGVEAGEKAAKGIDAVAEAALKATQTTQDLVDSLSDDVNYFGLDSNQRKIAELRNKGADEGLLAQAEAMDKHLKQLEKRKKLEEEALKLQKEHLSPQEKFNESYKHLNEMLQKNLLGQSAFDAELQKAAASALGERKTFGFAAVGSAEAYSRSIARESGNQQQRQIEALVAEAKRQTENGIESKNYLKNLYEIAKVGGGLFTDRS